MQQQQRPQTIESLLAIYRSDKDNANLQPDDYLRIIAYYHDEGDNDSATFTTGVLTARYGPRVTLGALTEKGIMAFADERYEDAIEVLTEVIKMDSESKNAYVVRAMAYGLSRREDRGSRATADMVKAGKLARIHNGVSV